MPTKTARLLLTFACFCIGFSGQALAQGLDEIIRRGKVIIASDLGAPPFGFLDADRKPDGADVELARLLAKDLGVELEIIPATSVNRVPYVVTKRVDIVISSLGIVIERAKSIAFSTPYAPINPVIFGPRSVDIKGPADLAGKRVGVTRGSGNESALVASAPPGTNIIRFDDESATMAALVAGQVDAYASGDLIARVLIPRYPEKGFEIKYVVRRSWSAIGMRRGDPDLLQWVNTFIFIHSQNGDLKRIYEKWIELPFPILPVL